MPDFSTLTISPSLMPQLHQICVEIKSSNLLLLANKQNDISLLEHAKTLTQLLDNLIQHNEILLDDLYKHIKQINKELATVAEKLMSSTKKRTIDSIYESEQPLFNSNQSLLKPNNESLNAICQKTTDAFNHLLFCNGLSYFQSYPTNELYRIFVDGVLYSPEGFGDCGFIDYDDREPASVLKNIDGLLTTLQYQSTPISLDIIKAIHHACTNQVKKFLAPGSFRHEFGFIDIRKESINVEGMYELLKLLRDHNGFIGASIDVVTFKEYAKLEDEEDENKDTRNETDEDEDTNQYEGMNDTVLLRLAQMGYKNIMTEEEIDELNGIYDTDRAKAMPLLTKACMIRFWTPDPDNIENTLKKEISVFNNKSSRLIQ